MANYISEIAKMLGVEFGEKFCVGTIGVEYVLTENGLFYATDGSRCDHILTNILTNKVNIKRKPWKPKMHQQYWIVDEFGLTAYDEWMNTSTDLNYYKLGNFYRTKEDAAADSKKWMAFYASDEVLEV